MLNTNTQSINFSGYIEPVAEPVASSSIINPSHRPKKSKLDLLQPLREKLDNIKVNNRSFAKLIAQLIPSQCPFERNIVIFGRQIAHIPPLCKLNPIYEELVGLRFRALCYLVDECGEDIQSYC
ncbi:MAG: Mo-dependent nitrogenase C-terminal domain-containing protein [Cyanobacteria bacterium P01_A01_bin.84]